MKARRMIAGTHEVPAGFLDREVAKRRRKPSKADYLSASKMPAAWVEGVVTNPPYRYAQRFAERAFYVALLLRTNFLMDAEDRGCWLDRNEPTRADYLLLRLPMMHREGWTGKRSSSNTPFSWAVWQEGAPRKFPQRLLEAAALYQKAGHVSKRHEIPSSPGQHLLPSGRGESAKQVALRTDCRNQTIDGDGQDP